MRSSIKGNVPRLLPVPYKEAARRDKQTGKWEEESREAKKRIKLKISIFIFKFIRQYNLNF